MSAGFEVIPEVILDHLQFHVYAASFRPLTASASLPPTLGNFADSDGERPLIVPVRGIGQY